MRAFAETGEGEGVGVVALVSEVAGYGFPAPAPSQAPPTNTYVAILPKDLLGELYPAPTIVPQPSVVVGTRRWGAQGR